MVLGIEALRDEVPGRANSLQDRVVILATAGDGLDDDVGDLADQGPELNLSGGNRGLKLLDPV